MWATDRIRLFLDLKLSVWTNLEIVLKFVPDSKQIESKIWNTVKRLETR
jgi:hypothetical protein